jgi:hypothetical protein
MARFKHALGGMSGRLCTAGRRRSDVPFEEPDHLSLAFRLLSGLPDTYRQGTLTVCRADLDGRTAVAHGLASTAGTKQNPLRPPDTPTMVTLHLRPWKTSDSYALC